MKLCISYLKSERPELEYKLEGKEHCEYDVEDVQEGRVSLRLPVELHGQAEGVDQDHGEDRVLKHGRRHERPQLVLDRILRNVPTDGFGIQRKLYAVTL